MAETIIKPKLQVRTQTSFNGAGDKNASPGTKLLINHGKPNFTIQRSPKVQENGEGNPLSSTPQSNANNNYNPYKKVDFVVKSTKFNGAFKPSSVPVSDKQPHQQSTSENEAAKVVLRRAKVAEPPIKDGEDENVPEFIRRQRRIQERLAKENVLDFESRRSGYFTHVMISPTSPNRTSFVETMSSPAVVPSLEMPPTQHRREETVIEEAATNGHSNGHEHEHVEEEEVNRAIEEVNKAVAGEEDDKSADIEHHEHHEQQEHHEHHEHHEHQEHQVREVHAAVTTHEHHESETIVTTTKHEHIESTVSGTTHIESAVATTTLGHIESAVATTTHSHIESAVATSTHEHIEAHVEVPTTLPHFEEPVATVVAVEPHPTAEVVTTVEHVEAHVETLENGHSDTPKENGHHATNGDADITISHTNSSAGPSLPNPDPSGALGVNFEPKTVVSFSQELGSEINKYPDTVKVTKEGESVPIDQAVQDLAKLKFDIKTDEQDVQVTPVLRTE